MNSYSEACLCRKKKEGKRREGRNEGGETEEEGMGFDSSNECVRCLEDICTGIVAFLGRGPGPPRARCVPAGLPRVLLTPLSHD